MKKYRELIVVSVLFIALLVWTFFTSTVTVNGVQLSQPQAGIWGVSAWFIIILLSVLGAYILHLIVTLISKIKFKTKKLKN